jgi:hypothetical protein
MIAAMLFIVLVSADGTQTVEQTPAPFKSITRCASEARATVKAMAGQSDWKIKSISCKPVVLAAK